MIEWEGLSVCVSVSAVLLRLFLFCHTAPAHLRVYDLNHPPS